MLGGLDAGVPACPPCYKHTWLWGCRCPTAQKGAGTLGRTGLGGVSVCMSCTQSCAETPALACARACTAHMGLHTSVHTSVPVHIPTLSLLAPLQTPPAPCATPSRCTPALPLSPPCPRWPHPATAPRKPASPPAQTHSCTPGRAAASARPRQPRLCSTPPRRHAQVKLSRPPAPRAAMWGGDMGVTARCGVLIAAFWGRWEDSAGLVGGRQTACLQPGELYAAASWVLHVSSLCPLESHGAEPSSPRSSMDPKPHSLAPPWTWAPIPWIPRVPYLPMLWVCPSSPMSRLPHEPGITSLTSPELPTGTGLPSPLDPTLPAPLHPSAPRVTQSPQSPHTPLQHPPHPLAFPRTQQSPSPVPPAAPPPTISSSRSPNPASQADLKLPPPTLG